MDRTLMAFLACLAGGALFLGACGTAPGDGLAGPSPAPDSPVSDSPEPDDGGPGDVPEPGDTRPERVDPQPGQADPQPISFVRAVPQNGDDTTLRVVFWSGVEPCYVLDRVEVDETPERVTITLYQGRSPDQENIACIEIALKKFTLVSLDAPLGDREVVDGAQV